MIKPNTLWNSKTEYMEFKFSILGRKEHELEKNENNLISWCNKF